VRGLATMHGSYAKAPSLITGIAKSPFRVSEKRRPGSNTVVRTWSDSVEASLCLRATLRPPTSFALGRPCARPCDLVSNLVTQTCCSPACSCREGFSSVLLPAPRFSNSSRRRGAMCFHSTTICAIRVPGQEKFSVASLLAEPSGRGRVPEMCQDPAVLRRPRPNAQTIIRQLW
jgi:hypothetical protein